MHAIPRAARCAYQFYTAHAGIIPSLRSSAEVPTEVDTPEVEEPTVLRYQDLTRNEIAKVKRVVTPKSHSGRLDVPEDIFKLWQDPKGQEKLLRLWCKSGGVKARKCEYDEDTNEYWVNVRTEGLLSREDIEELSRKRSHEQDTAVGNDFFSGMADDLDELSGGFPGGQWMPPRSPSEMCTPEPRTVKKLDGIVAALERCYDTMAELQAEGEIEVSDQVRRFATRYARGVTRLQSLHLSKWMGNTGNAPANELVEDARSAIKRDPCLVLKNISQAPLNDADNRVFEELKNAGYAFDVPITSMALSDDFQYPCIRPIDMMRKTIEAGFIDKVLGVHPSRAEQTFSQFWTRYRKTHPDHDLFDSGWENIDFNRLVPYYLHGDGGRTYKKGSILVLSMYSALGQGTAKNPVAQPDLDQSASSRKRKRHDDKWGDDDLQMGINLLGNSLANRFLFAAINVLHYKHALDRLDTLLDLWGKELRYLLDEGFEYGGHTWKVAVLGVTGDAPFLKEVGFHNRSFHNVRKSSTAKKALPGVCWLCSAGMTGGPAFEDTSIVSAEWIRTSGVNNPIPWAVPSPLLMHLPIDQLRPAEFYRPDFFHIYHAGVGKDFSASSCIYFLRSIFKARNIDISLETANTELRAYLKNTKDRISFSKLTFDLLGYESSKSFPVGHWSKNLDTATMMKFVERVAKDHLPIYEGDEILKLIAEASEAMGSFVRILLSSEYFLSPQQAGEAIKCGHFFLLRYMSLTKVCMGHKLCLFAVKPKLHMLAHLVLRMLLQYRSNKAAVINCISESTFMAEDFIGKVARLSRRVSPRLQGLKLLYRYLIAIERAMDAEK
eukprot:s710_g19.t2